MLTLLLFDLQAACSMLLEVSFLAEVAQHTSGESEDDIVCLKEHTGFSNLLVLVAANLHVFWSGISIAG